MDTIEQLEFILHAVEHDRYMTHDKLQHASDTSGGEAKGNFPEWEGTRRRVDAEMSRVSDSHFGSVGISATPENFDCQACLHIFFLSEECPMKSSTTSDVPAEMKDAEGEASSPEFVEIEWVTRNVDISIGDRR